MNQHGRGMSPPMTEQEPYALKASLHFRMMTGARGQRYSYITAVHMHHPSKQPSYQKGKFTEDLSTPCAAHISYLTILHHGHLEDHKISSAYKKEVSGSDQTNAELKGSGLAARVAGRRIRGALPRI